MLTIRQRVVGTLERMLQGEVTRMPAKDAVKTLSIYIPKSKMDKKPVARLEKLSRDRDRSINYLVVEAILEYLDRHEKK